MCHALVVDNDVLATRALGRLLRDDGQRVSPFENPHEALSALRRWPFDLVISDLEMPEADGRAVLRIARERQPNACVVIVTARALDVATSLLAEGACVVADKPLDYAALFSFLATCRARSARERHEGIFLRAARR